LTLVRNVGVMGGGERLARVITERLDPDRFERTLCVTGWSAARASNPANLEAVGDLRRSGARFLPISRPFRAALWSWWPVLSYLRRERVDILHAHQFGSNAWAAILGTLARTPVVIAHEHTWSYQGQPVRRFLDRELIARRSAAFLAVSREDRRRMIEIERIPADKIVYVPNGIAEFPPPSGHDVRAELGIGPEDPVVGTVCSLRPQKALDVLLRAAAVLATEFPRLRVLIVGQGTERRALEGLVEELGLEGTVILLGRRTDVPDLLEALDVAACSSDFEGSPLSIMEYMEAGKPVVATAVGGVPDLVLDGVTGILVEPQESAALAAAIGELLRDRGRAERMGEAGRERRRREFSLDEMVRRIERLYEGLYTAAVGGKDSPA
jgi:glycosyltransferase involved in cell wall biosynthesis